MNLHVILYQPRIPQNTGNIGRTCLAVGAKLHLIHPLGFEVTQKEIRRSGLDYWQHLDVAHWQSLEEFWQTHPFSTEHFLFTSKSQQIFFDAPLAQNPHQPTQCFLYFGREDAGLPEYVLSRSPNQNYKIPMKNSVRSINLAVSVGIALYEAVRQLGYKRVF